MNEQATRDAHLEKFNCLRMFSYSHATTKQGIKGHNVT